MLHEPYKLLREATSLKQLLSLLFLLVYEKVLHMNPSTMSDPTAPMTPPPTEPTLQQVESTLRITGWLGLWVELPIALVSAVMLAFVSFSRNLDDDTNNVITGFAILLGVAALVALAIYVVVTFRHTRFAKRLRSSEVQVHPKKHETFQLIRIGLIVAGVGAFLALFSSGVGTTILLAKTMAQPQGAAIYTPERVIRVLDVSLIMVTVWLAIAHFVAGAFSLWLRERLHPNH